MDLSRYHQQPRVLGHVIAGHPEEPSLDLVDRAAPGHGRVVSRVSAGTVADVDRAISAARKAFDHGPWPHTSGMERARILNRMADLLRENAELIASIESEEVGKPIRQALGDVEGTAGMCNYAAGLAMSMHGDIHTNLGDGFTGLITREPAGVVGMITPWNFPLLLAGQKVPYALGAGCTMVVKPSEFTSSTTLLLAEIATEAGVPAGVISVVTGSGSVVGQRLIESTDVDMISFTGSTRVGKAIARASESNLKRLSLELGGKSANIVFSDADLDDAIDGVMFGVFFNQGECCVSGSRLLIEDSIADDFLRELTERVLRLKIGDPQNPATDLGAIIHENHLNQILNHVAAAESQGAVIRTGGERIEVAGGGLYLAPTVIDQVRPGTALFREEIFGPVLSVTRFSTADEAIALANDVEYGLANSVWSKNIDTALYVSRRVRSGTVWVNTTIDGAPMLPGGGVKTSGYGREMGQVGFDEFTEIKTVQIRTGKRNKFYS